MLRMHSNYTKMKSDKLWSEMVTCYKYHIKYQLHCSLPLSPFVHYQLYSDFYLCQVQSKYSVNLVISLTCSQLYSQLQDMSDSQDYILDWEYDPHGEGLLYLSADHEEEPMD